MRACDAWQRTFSGRLKQGKTPCPANNRMEFDMSENTSASVETATFAPITPYAAAQVATRILGRDVTPQTMYGLARREQIVCMPRATDKDKVYFDGNAFKAWLDAQLSGVGTVTGRPDYDKLADLYTQDAGAPQIDDEGDGDEGKTEDTEDETEKVESEA